MIFTECPECDEPVAVPLLTNDPRQIKGGLWECRTCEKCGALMYIHHVRFGGQTLNQDAWDEMPAEKRAG